MVLRVMENHKVCAANGMMHSYRKYVSLRDMDGHKSPLEKLYSLYVFWMNLKLKLYDKMFESIKTKTIG